MRAARMRRGESTLRRLAACVFAAMAGLTSFAGLADPASPPSASPVEVAQALLAALEAGDADAVVPLLSPAVIAALPKERIAPTWLGLVAQAGALRERGDAKVAPLGEYQVVEIPLVFERASLRLRVTVDSAGMVAGFFLLPAATAPAEPPPDASFSEREVRVGAGAGALPGTLTVPGGEGSFPGVVLVHGSGPNDRDERVGALAPFRDIAWGLAERGVAVLRYDKRTRVAPAAAVAMEDRFTVEDEVIRDAVAAVSVLASAPEVDPGRTVVAGHSLGGYLGPRIAARAPRLAGLAILCGAARPLHVIVPEQYEYLARMDGAVTPEERQAIASESARAARTRSGSYGPSTPKEDLLLGLPAAYWRDLHDYDPTALARILPLPMLVVHGGRDYQCTMAEFRGWRRALAGRRDVTFAVFDDLNHLLVAGSGQSTPEEYMRDGRVAPAVIQRLADWVRSVPASRAP